MLQIIKMIVYRIGHNKLFLFLPFIVTPIVIVLSLYFTHNMNTNANIAVIGDYEQNLDSMQGIRVTKLTEEPKISELMQAKYDAVIVFKNDKYVIKTIKSDEFKKALDTILKGKNPNWSHGEKRGEIANLVGFIMMFVLLIGVMMFRFYYEEKDGIDKKILCTKVGYLKYCLSHCLVVFLMVYIPTIVVIMAFSFLHGFDTSVSNVQIIFIFGVLSLLGTTLGFLISSIIKSDETAILFGAMLVIITTLISGGFRSTTDNGVAKSIAAFLPQKYILDYTMSIENNHFINNYGIEGVIVLCVVLLLLALVVNRKRLAYVK